MTKPKIYEQARELVKADKKPQAVQLLVQCICENMNDYIAWDILYVAVPGALDKYAILKRLIKITPEDKTPYRALNNKRLQDFIQWAATRNIDLDKKNDLLIKDQIHKAKKLIAKKELADAAMLLVPIVCGNEKSAELWWLLAQTNPKLEQRRCQLERTVKLDPKLEDAQNMLKKLNEREYGRVIPTSDTPPMRDANAENQNSGGASRSSGNSADRSSGSSYDDGIRPVGNLFPDNDRGGVDRSRPVTVHQNSEPKPAAASTQTSNLKPVTPPAQVSEPVATSTQPSDLKPVTPPAQVSEPEPVATSTQTSDLKPVTPAARKTGSKPVVVPIKPDVPLEERLHTSSGMEWFSQEADMSIRFKDGEILISPIASSKTDVAQTHIEIVDFVKDQFNGLYVAGEEILVKGEKPTPIILPVKGKIDKNGRLQLTYNLPKPKFWQVLKKTEKSIKFDKVPAKDRTARKWIVKGLRVAALAAIIGLVLSKTIDIDKTIRPEQALLLGTIASVPFLYSLLVPAIKYKNYDELPTRVLKGVGLFAALVVGVPLGLFLAKFILQLALFCVIATVMISFFPATSSLGRDISYYLSLLLGMETGSSRRYTYTGKSARELAMDEQHEKITDMRHQREAEEKARADREEHNRAMEEQRRGQEVHWPDVQY